MTGLKWAYSALGTVVLQKVESDWAAPLYFTLMFVPLAEVCERGVCMAGKREMRRRSACDFWAAVEAVG